jgi:hypothetical protein
LFIYFKMDNFKMKLDPSNTNVAWIGFTVILISNCFQGN